MPLPFGTREDTGAGSPLDGVGDTTGGDGSEGGPVIVEEPMPPPPELE